MSTGAIDNGNPETVTLPETGGDDGGGETETHGGEAQAGERQQSRKERRKSEFDAALSEARAAREELARERQERERQGRELAEFRGRWEESQKQRQQEPTEDKYQPRIDQLEAEAQVILRQIAASKDPAEQDKLMKLHNAKMREAARLDFKREQEQEAKANPQQEPQQQGMSPRDQAMAVAIEADYPFVWDAGQMGQVFRSVTDRHYDRLRSEGKPDNLATLRAACALAAKELKIGGNDSPPNRGAYGGYSAGDGAGGRGEGTPRVEYGKHEAALAQALANRRGTGQSGDEAKQEWLKRVGPGVARRMSEE